MSSNILPLFYDNDPSNFYNHSFYPSIVKSLIKEPLSNQQFRQLYVFMNDNIMNISAKHAIFFFDFDGTLQLNEYIDLNNDNLYFIFGTPERQKTLAHLLYLSITYNRVYIITNNTFISKIAHLLNTLILQYINVKPHVQLFIPNYTVICTRFSNKLQTIDHITNKMQIINQN